MGGIYPPPVFGKGGGGQCFHPPLEMNEALAHLIYQHGKVQLQLFFDGLSLIFIIQLVEFIVNHWNKHKLHNCFPNCSHIQGVQTLHFKMI